MVGIPPSSSSMNRLSLAKEMYIVGLHHAQKNTRIDRMLAILNFDFAVTSIVVTCCIDNNQNTKKKNGRAKMWDEIIYLFEALYKKPTVIADLNNLHDLRNSIQHGDVEPSDSDIDRHKTVVKNLFDDICTCIYDDSIAYDSISMANLLKSAHEKEIMLRAEKYIEDREYSLSLYLIHTVALYHYMLIKTNLFLPMLPPYEIIISQNSNDEVKNIYEALSNSIDRLAMGEYYLRMKDLLKKAPPFFEDFEQKKIFALSWMSQLKPLPHVSYDEVEKARIDIYNIIIRTENIITEKLILDSPVIYGPYITEISQTSAKLNYGILCKLPIEDCILELYSDIQMNKLLDSRILPKESGYHNFPLDELSSGKYYHCRIKITQTGDKDHQGNRSSGVATFEFQTYL